jgi:SAM domain (Sterile alpha motif)
MTDLASRLESLGLSQYLESFISEGFDTWEILLDVQESDL